MSNSPCQTDAPDPRELVTVCSWCPGAKERTAELEARGIKVTHGICEACGQAHFADVLARRARIAAALIAKPVPVGPLGLPLVALEHVPSVACKIDREIEAITRGEEPRA